MGFLPLNDMEENPMIKHVRFNKRANVKIGWDAHNDLFQEITIQLWRAYPKFRGDSKFSTWMYRVGLNTAITLYRKSKRRIQTAEFDAEGIEHHISEETLEIFKNYKT